ncbi:hypothetical protein ACH5BK_09485 [Arcobacter sp. YIC-80]|uniref:hypothetical protein n=1 Tax=Arcobacter sp. YIC-80 TaxID=3376683 RepID=UPI003850C4B2
MNEPQVRKLPKKTIVMITIVIVAALIVFLVLKDLKEKKMVEILTTLGHKNVSSMEVINKLRVEDTKTRYKSTVYKVRFLDGDSNKTCIGFIHIGKDKKYSEDLDCK